MPKIAAVNRASILSSLELAQKAQLSGNPPPPLSVLRWSPAVCSPRASCLLEETGSAA
jgi:hypothetical protein